MLKPAVPLAATLALCSACSSAGEVHAAGATLALDAATRVRTEALMSQLRCAACHTAAPAVLERLQPEAAPDLARVGARKTPAGLRERLLHPHAGMPDLLGALGASERASTLAELVQFLATLGGPLDASSVEVDLGELERGRQLFHSVGCVACHAPEEDAEDLDTPLLASGLDQAPTVNPASDLAPLANSTTVDALSRFLVDPLAAHPAGRMPSLRLTDTEARSIATYLLRSQAGANGIQRAPGWECRMVAGEFHEVPASFEGQELIAQTTIEDLSELPAHPADHFALCVRGLLEVEQSGRYEFSTRSDDGSKLWIDGTLVVSNDGIHPPADASGAITLARGLHSVQLSYFEFEGGEELALSWRPPGQEKQIVPARLLSHANVRFAPRSEPFVADARAAERGRRDFARLGCATCHELAGVPAEQRAARPLGELAGRLEHGCLAQEPERGAPRFELDATQRANLRAVLADAGELAAPRSAAEQLDATIARLDCLACHARNGAGGPDEGRRPYFRAAAEVDLGNEGRVPPHLDGVGSKLYAAWMEKVLTEGAVERPYLATRMPQFGVRNVAGLAELFERVDGSAADLVAPAFSSADAEAGRKLAGSGGLLCIQCHVFDGVRSLGIPAVDLAHVRERIKPAWFQRLLLDPKSLGMNTRMPIFWDAQGVSAARTILGGDPQRQAQALWSYVSLGHSMPLPDGLVTPDSEYELTPSNGPILVGVFLKNASPRTLLVGNPELVHYAFDMENSRLVCAWRGRFFNARGTWEGRAGGLEWPQSDDLLEFARAPTLAHLATADAPWPEEFGRDAGFRRSGTRYDHDRRPTFHYRLGEVDVAESCVVLPRAGKPGLERRFELRSPRALDDLYIRADPASPERKHVSFERESDGVFAAHVDVEVSW